MNYRFGPTMLAPLLFCLPCFAINVATNSGFEIAGVGGDSTAEGWVFDLVGNATGERDSSQPSSGEWAIHLSANNGTAVLFQNTGAVAELPSLAPGSQVTYSFNAISNGNGSLAGGFLLFGIFNRDGILVVDQGNPRPLDDSAGVYVEHSFGLTVPDFGPGPNDYYEAFITIVAGQGPNSEPGELFIDNVVIEATLVPEPDAVLTVYFIGHIILVYRRRRR